MLQQGYPESLVELMERNPEARQFVMDYPEQADREEPIDISGDVNAGEIPLFLQWDERWGYETYGGDFLAVTGCGPTCLSMVYSGLSGDTRWNPYEVARMAEGKRLLCGRLRFLLGSDGRRSRKAGAGIRNRSF